MRKKNSYLIKRQLKIQNHKDINRPLEQIMLNEHFDISRPLLLTCEKIKRRLRNNSRVVFFKIILSLFQLNSTLINT